MLTTAAIAIQEIRKLPASKARLRPRRAGARSGCRVPVDGDAMSIILPETQDTEVWCRAGAKISHLNRDVVGKSPMAQVDGLGQDLRSGMSPRGEGAQAYRGGAWGARR